MTRELMECTIRDWVSTDPRRGARNLRRLLPSRVAEPASSEDIADALILLARREVAATRVW